MKINITDKDLCIESEKQKELLEILTKSESYTTEEKAIIKQEYHMRKVYVLLFGLFDVLFCMTGLLTLSIGLNCSIIPFTCFGILSFIMALFILVMLCTDFKSMHIDDNWKAFKKENE